MLHMPYCSTFHMLCYVTWYSCMHYQALEAYRSRLSCRNVIKCTNEGVCFWLCRIWSVHKNVLKGTVFFLSYCVAV